MSSDQNKYPIVEVIFELRWKLEDVQEEGFPKGKRDPYYAVFLGRLYEGLRQHYPHIERLSAENVPEVMAPYVLRQQFRTGKDGWPLVQVGPGIVTVNQTTGYSWDSFKSKISQLTKVFFEVYPQPDELNMIGTSLQFINAENFDYEQDDLSEYLKEHLKITVEIDEQVFKAARVGGRPDNFVLTLSYPCETPPGKLSLRVGIGTKNGNPGIIWETVVNSDTESVPQKQDKIDAWAEQAHVVARKWFDAMTGRA